MPSSPEPARRASLAPVLFPAGTSLGHRRRRVAFGLFLLVATSAVTWPGYPWLARAIGPALGLPASLATMVVVLAATFLALLLLYLTDDDDRRVEPDGPPPD